MISSVNFAAFQVIITVTFLPFYTSIAYTLIAPAVAP